MYEILLDDLHRLIEETEESFAEIANSDKQSFSAAELPELCGAILEVLGWTNTAYMENRLGINASLLTKFVKMRGTVSKRDALKVADRLRSYLKSEDQAAPDLVSELQEVPEITSTPQVDVNPASQELSIPGSQWVAVTRNTAIRQKIGAISALLNSIIEQASHPNVPLEVQALTLLERQQLIAILETALNVLRSPLIEKGLLKKTKTVLTTAAAAAARTGYQEALGVIMHQAGDRLGELLTLLFK